MMVMLVIVGDGKDDGIYNTTNHAATYLPTLFEIVSSIWGWMDVLMELR
jgi:hypothetical protein